MEPTISLPHWQDLPTCPYPEPNQSNTFVHFTSSKSIFFQYSPVCAWVYQMVLFLRFFNQISVCNFSLPMCLKYHDCLILLDFIMEIIFVGEQKSWKSSLCSLLCSPATSSFSGPFIFLNSFFSNTHSPHPFIPATEQVAHPCITTNKVIILYILIFVLVDNKVTKYSAQSGNKHSLNSICF